VLVFFEMDLSPGIKLSNSLTSGGHWGRSAFLLDRPISSELCDFLPIAVSHDTTQFSLVAGNAITFASEVDQASIWMMHVSSDTGVRSVGNSPMFKPHATANDAIMSNSPMEAAAQAV
jgi:hypothetical protein